MAFLKTSIRGLHFGITFAILSMAVAKKLIRRFPMEIIRRFVSEEEGQGLVEYALIIALIAIVAIVGLGVAGTKVNAMFNNIAGKL